VFQEDIKSYYFSSLHIYICFYYGIPEQRDRCTPAESNTSIIEYITCRCACVKMDNRPVVSAITPGPGLAILCLCSAAASALVAGTAVLYQAKVKRASLQDLEVNWNVILALGLVRMQLSPVQTIVNGLILQVVSIAQSSVTFKQVDYGLGYPISMVSPHDLLKFEQVSLQWERHCSLMLMKCVV
jgi:hypothetical protein